MHNSQALSGVAMVSKSCLTTNLATKICSRHIRFYLWYNGRLYIDRYGGISIDETILILHNININASTILIVLIEHHLLQILVTRYAIYTSNTHILLFLVA